MKQLITKLKAKAKELKKQILALFVASKRRDLPLLTKVFAIIIVAYAFSPIDLIPDFIPVLGFLDDIILLPAAIFLLIKMIPDDIMQQCKIEAEQMEERPKNYFIAVIIVLIWVGLVGLLVYKIAK